MKKIIAFDCDSTLSAIEGVDELARLAGDDIFRQVEDLTTQAMDGSIAIEDVFAKRLDLIQPTREQCALVGQMYLEQIEPTAKETIRTLQEHGWECIIISGGFTPCIEPLAAELGITRIEAVPLHFSENGSFSGFDEDYPTTRNGGKPEIIQQIKAESQPSQLVMIGDGVSDLETQPFVNKFFGYLGYTPRERVKQGANQSIYLLKELLDILTK